MLKRVLALTLALVLCLGILAGCQETPAGTTAPAADTTAPAGTTAPAETTAPTEPEPTSLFNAEDNVVIEMWMPNNKDLEAEGSYGNLATEKTINAKIEINEYDSVDTYTAMMAEQKVPALTYTNASNLGAQYGPDGAYINWYDYLDQMPNAKAVIEDERWAEDVAKFTYEEGVMYQLPIPQTGYASVYGYIYRQDIFEANNLEFPTTQEEFYNTLVKLKELYPDSYPFVMRQMTGNMQGLEAWCYTWGANHQLFGYYNTIMKFDHETSTYFFAQVSEPMREAVAFMKKLLDEGLMHPSSLTLDTAGWTEAFASNTSFIGFDKADRIPALTAGADLEATPDFTLTCGAPIAMGAQGVAATKAPGATGYSWLVSNLLEEEDLNNVLKYVDWLYSEEGITVTNWGIEGESYEIDANGNKVWKEDFTYAGSGLGVCSICGYRDFDAYVAAQPENIASALSICLENATVPGDPVLRYTEEEQDYLDTYYKALYDASLAELQKFILGQRDTETDWEAFINEMKALKMDEIIDIHQDAYNRIYG